MGVAQSTIQIDAAVLGLIAIKRYTYRHISVGKQIHINGSYHVKKAFSLQAED